VFFISGILAQSILEERRTSTLCEIIDHPPDHAYTCPTLAQTTRLLMTFLLATPSGAKLHFA
jgi:hypothetical protein